MTISPVNAGVGVPKVAFFILSLLCLAPQFYFGFVGGGIIGTTRMVAWNGYVRSRDGLARAGKRYSNIGLDRDLLCGGSKCADLSYRALAWRSYFRFDRIHRNRICTGITHLWSRSLSCAASGHSNPPNDKATRSEEPHVSPEVKDVFRKIHRLMDNEKAQNERLPEPYRSQVLRGADCDEIAGAVGEFGRDPRNPIPVNGPLGELIYLSNLRTANSQQIMFHRLGSISNVDIYETVSLDGAIWDILFLHQYHPRKSQRSPSGYRIVTGTERNSLLLGVRRLCCRLS